MLVVMTFVIFYNLLFQEIIFSCIVARYFDKQFKVLEKFQIY